MPDFSIIAVLLAGGQSRRMGRDKAAIEICGKPLWKRQLTLLQRLELPRVVISGCPERYLAAGVEVLADSVPDRGPLGGICAALRVCDVNGILVLAVDMPAMTVGFLQDLQTLACRTKAGVLPKIGHSFEPLAAVYPKAALPVVEHHLEKGVLSLQALALALIDRGLAVSLDVAPENRVLFRNLNTPADLTDFKASQPS